MIEYKSAVNMAMGLMVSSMYSRPFHNGPAWVPVNRLRDRVRNDAARIAKAEEKRVRKNYNRAFDHKWARGCSEFSLHDAAHNTARN